MIDLKTDIPIFTATDVTEPLRWLVSLIKEQPAYGHFFDAYRAMQADVEAQNLLAELRARQYQGFDEASYHQLLQRFYSRPTVKAYQAAEEALYDLLQAVDDLISEAAGIDFAANARRSCCGG
jgi:cell fate (sporulation/competence/biofilm development) regulator YlbF (YheA/YmcA/DUF963 family)